MKKLQKQIEPEKRLEAGFTEEDSLWLDKLERLMKKAPAGISRRMESFTTGDNYIRITPRFNGEMIKARIIFIWYTGWAFTATNSPYHLLFIAPQPNRLISPTSKSAYMIVMRFFYA